MPFSGPNQNFSIQALPEYMDYTLRRQQQETTFDQAMRQAQMAESAGRSLGQSIAEDNRHQEAVDTGRADFEMIPGVRGAASVRPYGITDSPELAPRQVTRFGKSFTYDPGLAAAQRGAATGEAQNAEDRTRLAGLQRIPGITPRMASRMVMGRTGVLDEGDPSELRDALSEYLRQPSRDAAARAVAAGANLNQFPDRFEAIRHDPSTGMEMSARPQAPVPGTAEWYTMRDRDRQNEEEWSVREIQARAAASAAGNPALAQRHESQQARLSLDEARKDVPRPSKIAPRILDTTVGRPATMVPNPAYQQAVQDSLAYESQVLDPARQRFQSSSGVPDAQSPSVRPDGLTSDRGPVGENASASLQTEARDVIAKINASALTDVQKRERINLVVQRLGNALHPKAP